MIRERWILGLAAAFVLVGLLSFHQLRQPQIYQAYSSLMFESTNPQVVDIPEVVDTSLPAATADTRLQTHIGQMKSTAFFNFVAAHLSEDEIAQIEEAYIGSNGHAPPLRNIVQSGIDASLNRGTFILTISARHRDPAAAALIANRYADLYIDYNQKRSAAGNQSAVDFLEERANELLQDVDQSEEELHRYRQEYNLVSLEENQNIILRRLNSLSASVVDARMARLELDSKLEHVENYLANDRPLMEIDYISDHGSLAKLMGDLDQLESQQALLEERYLERHPRVIENQRSLETIQRQIDNNIEMAVTELRSRHSRFVEHENKLKQALKEAEQESLDLEAVAVRYQVLRRKAAANRDSYARIVDRLNETRITSQLDDINIRLVDTADTPRSPVEPNLQKIFLQSAFLGCFIFLSLPLGLGMLDNKLKAAWEVELVLGLPLVGEIPSVNTINKRDRPHIITHGTEHSACEAFRGIFSQAQMEAPPDGSQSFLITSTLAGEGKSFVANNLATAFAAHGKRTLLVDCDLRRPSLHYFYERKNDRGIMRWIGMDDSNREKLTPTEALGILPLGQNFHLLRAGGETTNPTPIFDHHSFKSLLKELTADYDVILIDTPPIGIFPDSLLLAPLVQEVLFVCQFNRVKKIQIKKAVEKVQMTNVNIRGLILNGIPTGRASTYYNYYGWGQVGNKEYKAYYTQER